MVMDHVFVFLLDFSSFNYSTYGIAPLIESIVLVTSCTRSGWCGVGGAALIKSFYVYKRFPFSVGVLYTY